MAVQLCIQCMLYASRNHSHSRRCFLCIQGTWQNSGKTITKYEQNHDTRQIWRVFFVLRRLYISKCEHNLKSYLKKLKLDDKKTNLDAVKEMYEDIKKETEEESEELLKTANLSLDILSDLRGDNDDTMIEAPIKDEFMPEEKSQFYSSEYKFNKKDFDDKDVSNIKLEEDEDDFFDDEEGNGKFFFKVLLLIFGIAIVVVIAIYLISYFNRV